ncbi:MAG: hypothetical protein F4Y39_19920 [Gemmatimonadetes bacterium]|nr:hypothetical protein [Gemmatimonadota bacterium]
MKHDFIQGLVRQLDLFILIHIPGIGKRDLTDVIIIMMFVRKGIDRVCPGNAHIRVARSDYDPVRLDRRIHPGQHRRTKKRLEAIHEDIRLGKPTNQLDRVPKMLSQIEVTRACAGGFERPELPRIIRPIACRDIHPSPNVRAPFKMVDAGPKLDLRSKPT